MTNFEREFLSFEIKPQSNHNGLMNTMGTSSTYSNIYISRVGCFEGVNFENYTLLCRASITHHENVMLNGVFFFFVHAGLFCQWTHTCEREASRHHLRRC